MCRYAQASFRKKIKKYKTETEKRKTFLFLKRIRVHLLIFKKATLAIFVYWYS